MGTLEKPKRIVDYELLKSIRDLHCTACGKSPPNDPDHILTKASGSGDTSGEVWSLCRECHAKKHLFGLNKFVQLNPSVVPVLIEKGWRYDDYKKKWKRNLG